MRTKHAIELVFLLTWAMALQAAQSVRVSAPKSQKEQHQNENDLRIASVLHYSHALAARLSPADRMELLIRLAKAAGKQHPELARPWTLEVLQSAAQMPSGAQQVQYETEAISALASVDSDEASTLLPGIEFPASWKDCESRSAAAKSVFREFLSQHPRDWKTLAVLAQQLGDKGNYPFEAVKIVVDRIARKKPQAAAELLQQAIHYYSLSARGPCLTHGLAALLAENSRLISGSSLKAALEAMMPSLSKSENEDRASSALNERTLARLKPLITATDPDMEQELRLEHPDPGSAGNPVENPEAITNAVALSSLPAGETPSVIVLNMKPQPPTHPAAPQPPGAYKTVQVQSPSPEALAGLLHDLDKAGNDEGDPEQRLHILVERGISLISGERWAEFSSVLPDAFAVGEKLFDTSVDQDPQSSWRSRPGALELSTLVEAAAKSAPRTILAQIENVHNAVLQAELYVSFLEGAQSQQYSASVKVMLAEQ